MASFAKIDINGKVLEVVKVNDDVITDESGFEREDLGVRFLSNLTGYSLWKKTSYNTRGGIHYDPITQLPSDNQSKSFRKNFAGPGRTYDVDRDAFIPQKLASCSTWIFNEQTCLWEPPVPRPEGLYFWDDKNVRWVQINNENALTAGVNPPGS